MALAQLLNSHIRQQPLCFRALGFYVPSREHDMQCRCKPSVLERERLPWPRSGHIMPIMLQQATI